MIHVDALLTADPLRHAATNLMARQAARHGKQWCHMWSDTHNVSELVRFARMIGLKPEWLQKREQFPHFDLVPSKRNTAVRLGAVEVDLRVWLSDHPYEQLVAKELI